MRVKANAVYVFQASFWDIVLRESYTPANGELVRVVNLPGCPRANTMGHCHVQSLAGEFIGLVSCNSLQPRTGGGAK